MMMTTSDLWLLVLSAFLGMSLGYGSFSENQPWLNASLSPRQRAAAVVSNMTSSEKIQLLHGTGWGKDVYVGKVPGIKRLNIPDLNLNDGPQGYRCNGLGKCPGGTSTCFPSGLTVGASFDENTVLAWGKAMGREFYNKGANIQLGPGVCLARVPNNGRNFEYISGEDPYLGWKLVQSAVKGIQGQSVIANAKHFILNNQETNRNTINSEIDERTLWEYYLQPFQGAVEAGVGSFMCSYNKVNGDYSCGHNQTLNTDLKEKLGFEGFVMSDWGATHDTSILQGLDQEMPGSNYLNPDNLADAKYRNAIDESATRILTPLFDVGLMDHPNLNTDVNRNVSDAQSMRVAMELAQNTTILLKNDGNLLPLDPKAISKVVVVGEKALTPTVGGGGSGMVNPSYLPSPLNAIASRFPKAPNNCSEARWEEGVDYFHSGKFGSAAGTGAADCCQQCASISGCLYFSFKKSTKTCWFKNNTSGRRPDADVTSGGCYSSPPAGETEVLHFNTADDSVKEEAKDADLVIVFVATSSQEGGDRKTLAYGSHDDGNVEAMAAVNPKRTLVVAVSPGAVLMPWSNSVASIMLALMPGQMFADALASLLFADPGVAPAARLPITIPNKDNEQNFAAEQYPGVDGNAKYTEGGIFGYRWYDQHGVVPVFPFGHGISYSTFSYTGLRVDIDHTDGNDDTAAQIHFTVTNTGHRFAHEVSQLYLGFPASIEGADFVLPSMPMRSLRGFKKLSLQPGASAQVVLPLRQQDISFWDTKSHQFKPVHGDFTAFVGSSSRDLRLNGTFTLK